MGSLLMALDAGSGGGRCAVFDPQGNRVASHYREWSYQYSPDIPGGVQFDTEVFWGLFCDVIRRTLAELPGGARDIAAISATCMREGFVLLDAAGQTLYAGPSFDERGRDLNAQLGREMGPRFYALTGHWPASLHVPGKVLWLQQNQPRLWERVTSLLMIGDWVLYRLTAEKAGEPSNLCSTALMHAHSPDWADELLQRINLPRHILPRIGAAGQVMGRVTARAARETGLAPGTPVVLGGGDSQCALVGTGSVRPGQVTAVAGTTTPMLLVIDQPTIDPDMRPWTRYHTVPGLWCLEANAGLTGTSYRWARDSFFTGEFAAALEAGEDVYEVMTRRAMNAPLGAKGVTLVGAYRMDARNIDRMLAPGMVFGLELMDTTKTGLAEIVRATMENVCFAVRANAELLGRVSGLHIDTLRLCGGQARSPFWMQMQADVLGIPVLAASMEEASAWGAAICAGVGVGLFSDMAAAGRSLAGFTRVEPDSQAHAAYAPYFERWCLLYEQHSQTLARLD